MSSEELTACDRTDGVEKTANSVDQRRTRLAHLIGRMLARAWLQRREGADVEAASHDGLLPASRGVDHEDVDR